MVVAGAARFYSITFRWVDGEEGCGGGELAEGRGGAGDPLQGWHFSSPPPFVPFTGCSKCLVGFPPRGRRRLRAQRLTPPLPLRSHPSSPPLPSPPPCCRLFKVSGAPLEDAAEDYGQYATYLGTLPGSTLQYTLDDDTRCVKRTPPLPPAQCRPHSRPHPGSHLYPLAPARPA